MHRSTVAALLLVAAASSVAEGRDIPAQVFISEYVEGAEGKGRSDLDKALEFTNGLPVSVDLAAEFYYVEIWRWDDVGGMWVLDRQVPLMGVVGPGELFVVVQDDSSDPDLRAAADMFSSDLIFDGDNVVLLAQGGQPTDAPAIYWDVIGSMGGGYPAGGAWTNGSLSTRDMVLRRSAELVIPDLDPFDGFTLDLDQWQGFPPDSFGGLGVGGFVPVTLAAFSAE